MDFSLRVRSTADGGDELDCRTEEIAQKADRMGGLVGEVVMGWSAAPIARGLTTGKRGRLVPGYTARRPIGRATGGSAGNETQRRFLPIFLAQQRKAAKNHKEVSHENTHDRH